MPRGTHRHPVLRPAVAIGSALALGTAAMVATTGGASASSVNLVANGGFEAGALSPWSCSPGTAAVVSSRVHSGSYALQATPTGSDTAQCTQTVAVQPNSSYTLSSWAYGSYVYLGVTGTGTSDTSTWSSNSSWNQLTTSFTTGASTTSVTVYLHGWYGQGAYGADDVTLTGPAGPSPSPSGSPTPTPAPSGSPTPTPAPSGSPTSTPPPDTGFRHPVYFMPLDNNPQPVSDIIAGSGEKEFLLAFVLDSGGCTPAWGGDANHTVASDTTVAADVSAIRAAGGDVSVSFGGYNGTELGSSCGSTAALAAAYQQVIDKYRLTRIDLDWENGSLDANMAVRWGAIKLLEQKDPALRVTLTIPMTSVGLPDTGKDEIRQGIADGARIDTVNIMDFDFGLTGGTETGAAETVANDVNSQLQSLFGWDSATAWAHTSVQLMNGHTDQPSELFTQSTFNDLLGFVQSKHAAAFSYWDVNRDRTCDPSVPHNWADGACSSVSQNPYDFTKLLTKYIG